MLTKEQINRAIACLQKDQVVILLTDTIYGLTARYNSKNLKRINLLKNRPSTQPLIVLVSDLQQIENLAELDEQAVTILQASEPVTVILKAKQTAKTLGFRLIQKEDLKAIIEAVGPVYSTSVNKHQSPPLTSKKALEMFDPEVLVFFDHESQNSPSKIYNSVVKKWIR